jgi:protein-disulfide isomerase
MRGRRARIAGAVLTVAALGLPLAASPPPGDGPPGHSSALPSTRTPAAALTEALEADGTTITVGDPRAPLTVRLYEDPRCPSCQAFERDGGGPQLRALVREGKLKVQYVMASFLDGKLGGTGSHNAVNALRAALERGKFAEYHALLYAHQPEESEDGFTEAYLLRLADEVEGLRSPSFDAAVKGARYREFAAAAQEAFDRADVPGTPTIDINGERMPDGVQDALYDKDAFAVVMSVFLATQPDAGGQDAPAGA